MRVIIAVLSIIVLSGSIGEHLTKEKPGGAASDNVGEKLEYYTVKQGDHLFGIGGDFGSGFFWESIYIRNAGKIANPHLIFPGQVLVIPYYIVHFHEKNLSLTSVLNQPFCAVEISEIDWDAVDYRFLYLYDEGEVAPLTGIPGTAEGPPVTQDERDRVAADGAVALQEDSAKAVDVERDTLEAFREAFEELVRQQEAERQREQVQAESERRVFVEIDGMIHDDTRSKIGRDFYEIFYANWQSPPEASHYAIRVTEQPAPNLGTVIAVEVNNTETFRARLQPRYDFIEEASHIAIRRTYLHLQQSRQQYRIY